MPNSETEPAEPDSNRPLPKHTYYLCRAGAVTAKRLFKKKEIAMVFCVTIDNQLRVYMCSRYKSPKSFDGWRLQKREQINHVVQLAQEYEVPMLNLA
jgi:hypothetical protein